MDRTDLFLIQALMRNSRIPYRELAEQLELSVNAVHKRIQGLIDEGVIKKFIAKASFTALDGAMVLVYGIGEGRDDDVTAALGEDERVYWVSHASGGMLYVGGYLRNIIDLEEFTSMVRKKAGMTALQVGMVIVPPTSDDQQLTRLDFRIIDALADDSRKAVSDIAEELGVSAKTVRRRLARLTDEDLISFSLDWTPDKSNDLISIFHLKLRPDADRFPLAMGLMQRHAGNTLFFFLFINQPDSLLLTAWCRTIADLNDLRKRLEDEPDVVTVTPNILYSGEVFETWRERTIRRNARSAKGQTTD